LNWPRRLALILDHAGNWERHGLYDFPHQWSLERCNAENGATLIRRCPQCGAVMAIRAEECPECPVFVRVMPAPRIPSVTDDLELRVTTRGGALFYPQLLRIIAAAPAAPRRRRARPQGQSIPSPLG
jgi:hypothetical protein